MKDQRYLVAARKYRPTCFGELVAQEHVTDTLRNALRLDRMAHAYLFSGPRGVGKTTAARILAKAINCETPLEEREDGAEPCRTCPSCRTFEEGRSLNIIELDAASNNKVDDIRDLRETVRIPPQGAKKKVYIVDEVHMLSNQAFNAFLKTLEEPPPHVLFIFATTEPHKVLPTILSRCQRFDFRRIPVPAIVTRLREICKKEGIEADEASLMLIARKGDGALRDALSTFDQAVSLCGTELNYGELAQALGVVDLDLFFRLTDHIRGGDSAGVLRLVEEVGRAGYDLQEFLAGLAEHLRNLLVARTMDDLSLVEATQATRQRYAEAAGAFSEADLLRLLLVAGQAEGDLAASPQPRLKVEMALLKMAGLPHATDLREALEKLDRLEALAREGRLATPSAEDDPSSPGNASASGANGTSTPKKATAASSEDQAAARRQRAPSSEEPPPAKNDEPPSSVSEKEPASRAGSGDAGYADLFGTPALKRAKKPNDGPVDDDAAPHNTVSTGLASAAVTTTVEVPTAWPGDLWTRFVQAVRERHIRLGSLLRHATPHRITDGTATIAVPDAFHRSTLKEQHSLLIEALPGTGSPAIEQFHFVVEAGATAGGSGETATETDPYEALRTLRAEHPVVRALFDTFGGEVVYR